MTRNALALGDWIITTDNSAAIGEKPADVVAAPDEVTANFAARVALLEQWAAGSEPEAVLLQNFSGDAHWHRYVEGIEQLFSQAGIPCPPISGSSETNMETMQSAVSVTLLGKRKRAVTMEGLHWFLYGVPLVGQRVLLEKERVADLKVIQEAIEGGLAERVWPVGSQGVASEAERMIGKKPTSIERIDSSTSGGPCTSVLIGVAVEKVGAAMKHFGAEFVALQFES